MSHRSKPNDVRIRSEGAPSIAHLRASPVPAGEVGWNHEIIASRPFVDERFFILPLTHAFDLIAVSEKGAFAHVGCQSDSARRFHS
jgi:hypothetical protein